MLFGPDPLTERLTLMWHNHFATSNLKVNDLAADAAAERDASARSAGPRSASCWHAMLRDPALLIWLDAPENSKGHPNENLARELMELFTLGHRPLFRGRRQGGRPRPDRLDGSWATRSGSSRSRHDAGEKTILGRTGALDGDGLVRLLLEHPATARRLAWRLCHEFFGEGAVDEAAIDALAEGLRAHDLDIGWGVATVLRSRLFFDAANLGTRVVEPDRVRRRRGAGAGDARPGAEHAGAGRLVRRGWARTCSIRPTSAAGPAAGPGSRRDRRSAGRISPRPWSRARRSAWPARSTRSRWPARHGQERESGVLRRDCCSGPTPRAVARSDASRAPPGPSRGSLASPDGASAI